MKVPLEAPKRLSYRCDVYITGWCIHHKSPDVVSERHRCQIEVNRMCLRQFVQWFRCESMLEFHRRSQTWFFSKLKWWRHTVLFAEFLTDTCQRIFGWSEACWSFMSVNSFIINVQYSSLAGHKQGMAADEAHYAVELDWPKVVMYTSQPRIHICRSHLGWCHCFRLMNRVA